MNRFVLLTAVLLCISASVPLLSQQFVLEGNFSIAQGALAPAAEDEFWYCGSHTDLQTDSSGLLVGRIRTDGEILSWRKIEGKTVSEAARLANGDLIVAGKTTSGSFPMILCLDSLGRSRWGRTWEGLIRREVDGMTVTSDTTVMIVLRRPKHLLMQEFSKDGEVIRNRTYRSDSSGSIQKVLAMPDGSLLCAGISLRAEGRVETHVLRFDRQGEPGWGKSFAVNNYFNFLDAAVGPDGRLVVVGQTNDHSVMKIVVLELDMTGTIIRAFAYDSMGFAESMHIAVTDGGYRLFSANPLEGLYALVRFDAFAGDGHGEVYGGLENPQYASDLIVLPAGIVGVGLNALFDRQHPYFIIRGGEEDDSCNAPLMEFDVQSDAPTITAVDIPVVTETITETGLPVEGTALDVNLPVVQNICSTSGIREERRSIEETGGRRLFIRRGEGLVLPAGASDRIERILIYDLLGRRCGEIPGTEVVPTADRQCRLMLPPQASGFLHVVVEYEDQEKSYSVMVE